MATSDAENQMNSSEPDDIVAEVRQYLADLPEQPGLAAARLEGEQIAAIVEPLGLPKAIIAAVHAYPLLRDGALNEKQIQNNPLAGTGKNRRTAPEAASGARSLPHRATVACH